jgi:hypothetical protein
MAARSPSGSIVFIVARRSAEGDPSASAERVGAVRDDRAQVQRYIQVGPAQGTSAHISELGLRLYNPLRRQPA